MARQPLGRSDDGLLIQRVVVQSARLGTAKPGGLDHLSEVGDGDRQLAAVQDPLFLDVLL